MQYRILPFMRLPSMISPYSVSLHRVLPAITQYSPSEGQRQSQGDPPRDGKQEQKRELEWDSRSLAKLNYC